MLEKQTRNAVFWPEKKKCCFLPELFISSLSLFSPLSFFYSGAGLEPLSEEDTLDKHGTSGVFGMLLAPDLLPMERRRLEGWRNPGHGAEGREKTAPLFSGVSKASQLRRATGVCWAFYFMFPASPFIPCVKQLGSFDSRGQGM